jgi:aspartyl-tRNA(Asn)/glutamyl-tRNA(Gln) amidotransferase subunit C
MLSLEQIQRIGDLARLELSATELAAMQQELNGILKLVDEMASVDTEGVEPMSHPQAAMQRLREDAVSEVDQREQFQAIAPQVEDGLYLVPKVIE